jgi:hypothetical protein
MPTPLRVLIVEDSLPDAALIVRELKAAGFAPERHVAASKDGICSTPGLGSLRMVGEASA